MYLPESSQLNIGYLSRLFDNTSNCYKFFWFKAILTKLEKGKTSFTFSELVDEMIADAWYMVNEYHLRLGPNGVTDNLEEVVKYIYQKGIFKSAESREAVIKYLEKTDDSQIRKYKRELILNVPYRLQTPFYDSIKLEDKWNGSKGILTNEINRQEQLIYYFLCADGLDSKIEIQRGWADYLLSNIEIVRGWLELNLIHYLQKRNPSVPGIADKLEVPKERKLEKAKKYWKAVIDITEIRNIYTGDIMTPDDLSIDHFVPWSYVAHDELWNLVPTTRAINSSKSNSLPDWDIYFPRLSDAEYRAYRAIKEYDHVKWLHKAAADCLREHVNNEEIRYRLYNSELDESRFKEQLANIIRPSYDSALNMGFRVWNYE